MALPQETRRQRFERLALPHLDALFALALRLCHNERDAEDLVQDALLRAYQAFDQFQGDERCKPWLLRIVTNDFINRYRRKSLERNVQGAMEDEGHLGFLSADSVQRSRGPEEMLHGARLYDDLQRALAELPEEFRVAVLLGDIEEFSYREIADIMDCPVGTVMSRLHRGRRLLQAAFSKQAEKGRRPAAEVIPLRGGRGK